jgi:cytochrome c553
MMSESSQENQLSLFVDAMRRKPAVQILELGTVSEAFLSHVVACADWATSIELHCTDSGSPDFDSKLAAAGENISVEFNVTKHVGSDTDINDALMQIAESRPFDAAFISDASSKEALLTACMVCHESLGSAGVIGIDAGMAASDSLAVAISTFLEMFGADYQEIGDYIFVKA